MKKINNYWQTHFLLVYDVEIQKFDQNNSGLTRLRLQTLDENDPSSSGTLMKRCIRENSLFKSRYPCDHLLDRKTRITTISIQ